MEARSELRPIDDDDIDDIAAFLHDHLNPRISTSAWKDVLAPPWYFEGCPRGLILSTPAGIVGASVLLCSRRTWHDTTHTVGNLAALSVLPGHEIDTARLLRAQLREPGIEFTDLAPTARLVPINSRLGFSFLETGTRISPNLPWLHRPGVRIIEDPALIIDTLGDRDASIYQDHRAATATRHIVVVERGAYAYLVIRRQEWPRWRRRPVIALPLYVGGDREVLRRNWAFTASYILTRHGLVATYAERRILGFAPRLGVQRGTARRRMVRLSALEPEAIDYLYSDLALFEAI